MKKFEIPCTFGNKQSVTALYIGNPEPGHNPLHFQADWLSKERGGQVPPQIMQSLDQILKIAISNNVSFEDLCFHALSAADDALKNNQSLGDAHQSSEDDQTESSKDSKKDVK